MGPVDHRFQGQKVGAARGSSVSPLMEGSRGRQIELTNSVPDAQDGITMDEGDRGKCTRGPASDVGVEMVEPLVEDADGV